MQVTIYNPRVKHHSRVLHRGLLFVALLAAGLWLRNVQSKMADSPFGWQPWARTRIVTLYFSDGRFLFPLSRRLPAGADLPRATLDALMSGPPASSSLRNSFSPRVQLRAFKVEGGIAHVDLSAVPDHEAETAIVETLTAVSGITSVEISAEGKVLGQPAKRMPALYFASMNGLLAIPVTAATPFDALALYLSGPPAPDLAGLPPDVRLLAHDFNSGTGVVSLKFSYTPSLRELAIERPDRMRTVLLGLIATMTEFPEVRAVALDFGGQTRLGLGQCSDLLRTPQPRPALLNDERLL
jgi:spore germination protein GerM